MDSFSQTFFRNVDEVAAPYLQPRCQCPDCHLTLRYDAKYRIIQCSNCAKIFDVSNINVKAKKIMQYDCCPTCNTVCCYLINSEDIPCNVQIECCKCTLIFQSKKQYDPNLQTNVISSREIRSTRVFHAIVVKPWPPCQ